MVGDGGEEYPIGRSARRSIINRAIRDRWAIPPEAKDAIIQQAIHDATKLGSPRHRAAALRNIAALDKLNLQAQESQELEQLAVEDRSSGIRLLLSRLKTSNVSE